METTLLQYVWLIPLGVFVGTVGTLIGSGGGFILVPILLLLFPALSPQSVTGISLAVVFFNALSGSFAYAGMKRIDYKSGLIFAGAALPGSVAGAWMTQFVPRFLFDLVFGSLLIVVGVLLALQGKSGTGRNAVDKVPKGKPGVSLFLRTIIDWEAVQYVFSYNPIIGVLISVLIGFVSSLLGIGGGIFHVPLLATALNFPVHIATATSHFVLAITSLTGSFVHLLDGELIRSFGVIAGLSFGVIGGAQWGARLSQRFHGVWIIRFLAGSLVLVGVRLLLGAL